MEMSTSLSTSMPMASLPDDDKLFSLTRTLKSKETPEELKKVAKEFESIFMQQVFQAMDQTVDRTEGLLSGGPAEETFRGMFYESIASDMAKPGSTVSMGLSDAIYRQLLTNLPSTTPTPSATENAENLPQSETKRIVESRLEDDETLLKEAD